jgi:peptidyl-prolyl cis-trans isomerase C
MKKSRSMQFWGSLILICAVFSLALASFAAKKEEKSVTAKIGKKEITEAEVQKQMEEMKLDYRIRDLKSMDEKNLKMFRKMILNRIIERDLIMETFAEKKLKVSKDEVKEKMEEMKSRFPDEKDFISSLAQQGKTVKELEEKIEEGLKIRKVIESLTDASLKISDAEVKAAYDDQAQKFTREEEVEARHILIKVDKDASKKDKEDTKKKLEDLRKKIIDGEDFAKLAAENSGCPSGKRAGGSLGFFGKGKMVPAFDKAAFSLEKGKVSEVIETSFGYHIIEVTGKHDKGKIPFEEVKEKLKEELEMNAKGKAFMEWLKLEKAKKVIFTNPEDKDMEPENQNKNPKVQKK